MATASKIHPTKKLGLNKHGVADKQLLKLNWANDKIPSFRAAVDNLSTINIGLDKNDVLGDCGPTSVDNHRRIMTLVLNGLEVDAKIAGVLDLYTRSTKPPFNAVTGANDNGVDMLTMMKACMSGGLEGDKIVAYAKLSNTSDASVMAAIDLFGAVLFAVDLQIAQQAQSDAPNPVWDYKKSGVWGGHAIVAAAYDSSTGIVSVGSWGMKVGTTAAFRSKQLDEVWVPIYQWILDGDDFNTAVDTTAFYADYTSLTGGTLPGKPAPTPTPTPTPVPTPPSPTPTPTPVSSFLTVGPFTDSQLATITRRANKLKETPSDWVLHTATQAVKVSWLSKFFGKDS